MQDQHGIPRRVADGSVMQAQLGHDFAGMKAKVSRGPVALLRWGIIGSRSKRRCERERECSCDADGLHSLLPGCGRSTAAAFETSGTPAGSSRIRLDHARTVRKGAVAALDRRPGGAFL